MATPFNQETIGKQYFVTTLCNDIPVYHHKVSLLFPDYPAITHHIYLMYPLLVI